MIRQAFIVQQLLRFLLVLTVLMFGLYFFHTWLKGSLLSEENMPLLNFSYKFNGGITFLFTTTIFLISQKLKEQIGFIFLAGTFIKLGLFFYLSGSLGFEVDKSSFLDFFIPYTCCLIVELFFVARLLKKIDEPH